VRSISIFKDDEHEWIMLGRDPEKPDQIIDTNQYMITTPSKAIILDPGGIELYAPMLAAVLRHVPLENIRYLFASHQDPDIISSLGLWDKTLQDATLYGPWLWESFIRHFGMDNVKYHPLKDEGGSLDMDGCSLQFVPAHYLHSSGNFHVYDARAKILMSGDVGAALEPISAPIFVEDFSKHVEFMKGFHQRWMPSNRAKQNWISRVKELDIEIMAPQHGRLFKGEAVQEFLEWFSQLDVGIAV
jgi:flavorubredoxin